MAIDVAILDLVTDVELRHLAAMAAIVEEGSFGRAATRLAYTQSTVSQQIAALERAVGGPVFDRPGGPKPVRLTPLGSVVLTHGRELLAKAEALADAVDRFKAGDGRIDIGTFQSVSNVILPSVVRRLRDEHHGCDIRLSEEEPEQRPAGVISAPTSVHNNCVCSCLICASGSAARCCASANAPARARTSAALRTDLRLRRLQAARSRTPGPSLAR